VLVLDNTNLAAGTAVAAQRSAHLSLIHADDGATPQGLVSWNVLLRGGQAEDAGRTGNDLFTLLYTGGTTGRSKGVMLSHANSIMSTLSALSEGLFAQDAVYLNAMPLFHTGGLWPWISTLASAARTVVIPGFEAGLALAEIERERVTESLLVPTMIQRLIEHPRFAAHDLRSFKRILYGASPITEALLDRAIVALPQVGFVQLYGMTELAPLAAVLHDEHLRGAERARGRHRAAGRATYGVELRIVDAKDEPVPQGTVGEIVVRGPNVMLGYWDRAKETAAALRGGWMHTGDGGYLDEDGFVYVVDRVKDMIISGGENIFSVEVENALALHPAVRQCAVIGLPHAEWMETVHAVVVLHDGQDAAPEQLIAHCRTLIAGYKCPRSVEFRSEMPISAAGKILKRELRRAASGQ
jgi:long-chain acyl-CoA synthetase